MMKQQDLQLTGGNDKGSRRKLDFYPTPPEVTEALMLAIDPLLPKNRIIWEPCCGDYAMSSVIEKHGYQVISTDIKYGDDYMLTKREADAIITNPPFYLSEDIIRKARTEVRFIALLLKTQYWHSAKRKALFDEFPPSCVFPLTWRPDFLPERIDPNKNNSPTMEVCWNVWFGNTKEAATIYRPLSKPRL